MEKLAEQLLSDANKRFIDKNQGDLAYDHDELPVFLARNPWHLQNATETWPEIKLLKTREQTG